MTRRLITLALSAALAAAATTATGADRAKGDVRLGESAFTVADAIAIPDDDGLDVVVSDKPFDRAAMTRDGKVDTFDVMRHEGNTLTINFDADGPTMCVDFSFRDGDGQRSGSSCNSDYPPTVHLSSRDADSISGRMSWGEEGADHVHVDFDLSILSAAATASGDALPADGGDPGKAVLAHFAAVESGDWKKLKAISHPENRAQMEASEKAGEHAAMFEFLKTISPKKVRVTGGRLRGDEASVDFVAEEDGKPIKGTADVVRVDGRWYYQGSSSRS